MRTPRPSSAGLGTRLRQLRAEGIHALTSGRRVPLILLALALALFPFVDPDKSHVNVAADAGVYVLLALGLNIVVGFAGLLDLGYAAFFAIGTYAYALLASGQFNLHFPFWILLVVSAIIAATFGVLLGAPTLPLRGDYPAIVTLGFGEIVPRVFRNAETFTGGVNGIVGLDQPSLPAVLGFPGFSFGFNPMPYYFLILAIVFASIVLINNLRQSRLGRAWMAIREDEVAAAAMGINTVTTKLLAFAMGAAFSGFAGTYYSAKLFIVSPDAFSFVVSVTILVMIVLGGMGSLRGVIVGALMIYFIQFYVLIQLPGWIRTAANAVDPNLLANVNIADYVQRSNYLIFGTILVVMMLLRPQGLIASAQRKVKLEQGTVQESVADLRGSA